MSESPLSLKVAVSSSSLLLPFMSTCGTLGLKTSSKGKNTCKSYLHRKLVCRPKPKLKSSTSSCNSACVRAKWLQSCPTLCNPMDCSPPNSSVHGIFHARTLEWVAMPSSRGIFPIQVLNPHLLCRLHWQMDSLPIVPPGKPIAP